MYVFSEIVNKLSIYQLQIYSGIEIIVLVT